MKTDDYVSLMLNLIIDHNTWDAYLVIHFSALQK